jgi:hypothetical protein
MTSLALFWAFCNRFPLNEERRLVECSQSAMNHPIVIRFIVGFWKETYCGFPDASLICKRVALWLPLSLIWTSLQSFPTERITKVSGIAHRAP